MVVVSGNKLVGKIVEVFPYYSKVLLVTDPLCKVAVKTAKTGVKGIHEGCLSLDKTTIKYMSHLETIEQNDLVLTSGEGLVFPQGFAVGILQEFFIKNLQYQVTVKPVINFQTLAYCTIVQKGSELVAQPSLDN
jgi:rod shape-determining protein MreC